MRAPKTVPPPAWCVLAGAALFLSPGASAGTTPMTAPLPEDKQTAIQCEYDKTEPEIVNRLKFTPSRGSFRYDVYVPAGYGQDPTLAYPCMFIASPAGNADMGRMAPRLKRDRWLVVMLVDSRDGAPGTMCGNFLAAHDDAVVRLRVLDGLKLATGAAGGATACSVFVTLRPGFGGLICQGWGAGMGQVPRAQKDLGVIALFGLRDPALGDLGKFEGSFSGGPFAYKTCPGGPGWAPPESFDDALDWIENNLLLNSPAGKLPGNFCVHLIMTRHANLVKEPSALRRYESLALMNALAGKGQLAGEAQLKDVMRDVAAQLKALQEDQALAAEREAKNAYLAAEANERSLRGMIVSKNLAGIAARQKYEEMGRRYSAVADKFKNTEYGKRAAEMVEALKRLP